MAAKKVLITGSPDHVAAMAKRFAASGVEQVTLAQLGPGASAIDYYVQLGVTVPARGDTIVRRVHSFLNDGLLERFAMAERVLPMLADDAVVLLVAGNLTTEASAPDDHAARLSLLRVLAHAIRADLAPQNVAPKNAAPQNAAPKKVRVRVISNERTDDEIAEFAFTGAKDPQAIPPSLPDDITSGGSYEDWRIQMMGLVHIES
jgi:hypothetical protein